jgi:hypothetical protein
LKFLYALVVIASETYYLFKILKVDCMTTYEKVFPVNVFFADKKKKDEKLHDRDDHPDWVRKKDPSTERGDGLEEYIEKEPEDEE